MRNTLLGLSLLFGGSTVAAFQQTVIPCGINGNTTSTCTITATNQLVTLSSSTTTSTATITSSLAARRVNKVVVPCYSEKYWVAPYQDLGPLALPDYDGSGLCGKCDPPENDQYVQTVSIVECSSNAVQSTKVCRRYAETWSRTAQGANAPCTLRATTRYSAPSAGTYTFTFGGVASRTSTVLPPQITTITLRNGRTTYKIGRASTIWYQPQPYNVEITKVVNRGTIINIQTTITTIISVFLPTTTVTATNTVTFTGGTTTTTPARTTSTRSTRSTRTSTVVLPTSSSTVSIPTTSSATTTGSPVASTTPSRFYIQAQDTDGDLYYVRFVNNQAQLETLIDAISFGADTFNLTYGFLQNLQTAQSGGVGAGGTFLVGTSDRGTTSPLFQYASFPFGAAQWDLISLPAGSVPILGSSPFPLSGLNIRGGQSFCADAQNNLYVVFSTPSSSCVRTITLATVPRILGAPANPATTSSRTSTSAVGSTSTGSGAGSTSTGSSGATVSTTSGINGSPTSSGPVTTSTPAGSFYLQAQSVLGGPLYYVGFSGQNAYLIDAIAALAGLDAPIGSGSPVAELFNTDSSGLLRDGQLYVGTPTNTTGAPLQRSTVPLAGSSVFTTNPDGTITLNGALSLCADSRGNLLSNFGTQASTCTNVVTLSPVSSVTLGSGSVTSGVGSLTSGLSSATSGVGSLTSGVIGSLTSGVGSLTSGGVGSLTSGVGSLTSGGLGSLTSGVGSLTSDIGSLTSGVGSLTSGGVGSLTSGVGSLTSGVVSSLTSDIGSLTSGVGSLTSGVGSLTSGVGSLTSGIGSLTSGVGSLTSGVVSSLTSDIGSLTSGVGSLTSGVGSLTSGVGSLTSGVGSLTSGVGSLTSGAVGTLTSGVGSLTSGVGSLTSGVGSLTSGVGSLTSGVGSLTSGVGSLTSGVGSLTSGVGSLTSGVGSLTSGVGSLTSGVGSLTSGVTSGVGSLTSGVGSLTSGVGSLTSGLPSTITSLTSIIGSLTSSVLPTSTIINQPFYLGAVNAATGETRYISFVGNQATLVSASNILNTGVGIPVVPDLFTILASGTTGITSSISATVTSVGLPGISTGITGTLLSGVFPVGPSGLVDGSRIVRFPGSTTTQGIWTLAPDGTLTLAGATSLFLDTASELVANFVGTEPACATFTLKAIYTLPTVASTPSDQLCPVSVAPTSGTIGLPTSGVIGSLTSGAVGSLTSGVVGSLTSGAVGSLTSGAVGSLTSGAVGSLTSGNVGSLTSGAVGSLTSGAVGSLTSGVVGSLTSGVVGSLTSGVVGSLTSTLSSILSTTTALPAVSTPFFIVAVNPNTGATQYVQRQGNALVAVDPSTITTPMNEYLIDALGFLEAVDPSNIVNGVVTGNGATPYYVTVASQGGSQPLIAQQTIPTAGTGFSVGPNGQLAINGGQSFCADAASSIIVNFAATAGSACQTTLQLKTAATMVLPTTTISLTGLPTTGLPTTGLPTSTLSSILSGISSTISGLPTSGLLSTTSILIGTSTTVASLSCATPTPTAANNCGATGQPFVMQLSGISQCLYVSDNRQGSGVQLTLSSTPADAETFFLQSNGQVVSCEGTSGTLYYANVNAITGLLSSPVYLNTLSSIAPTILGLPNPLSRQIVSGTIGANNLFIPNINGIVYTPSVGTNNALALTIDPLGGVNIDGSVGTGGVGVGIGTGTGTGTGTGVGVGIGAGGITGSININGGRPYLSAYFGAGGSGTVGATTSGLSIGLGTCVVGGCTTTVTIPGVTTTVTLGGTGIPLVTTSVGIGLGLGGTTTGGIAIPTTSIGLGVGVTTTAAVAAGNYVTITGVYRGTGALNPEPSTATIAQPFLLVPGTVEVFYNPRTATVTALTAGLVTQTVTVASQTGTTSGTVNVLLPSYKYSTVTSGSVASTRIITAPTGTIQGSAVVVVPTPFLGFPLKIRGSRR